VAGTEQNYPKVLCNCSMVAEIHALRVSATVAHSLARVEIVSHDISLTKVCTVAFERNRSRKLIVVSIENLDNAGDTVYPVGACLCAPPSN
jgi:hypothetical protein